MSIPRRVGQCSVLWALLAAAGSVAATDRAFYSVIGPDGKMMVIERPASTQPSDQPPSATVKTTPTVAPTVSRAVAPKADAAVTNTTVVPPSAASAASASVGASASASKSVADPASVNRLPNSPPNSPPANSARAPFSVVDGEKYVDSEYLEQREFNLEGKKRFYALPDGLGGVQLLEREKGVNLNSIRAEKKRSVAPQVSLSVDYQRIPQADVQHLIGQQCVAMKRLKPLDLIYQRPFDLWPRPSDIKPKADKNSTDKNSTDFPFVGAELHPDVRDINLLSYASSSRMPRYYWPLVIFLDAKGCVLEGANQFFQSAIPATLLQQAALQGHLHIPLGSRYVLLTPLADTPELAQVRLSEKGQLRLQPIADVLPP